MGHYTHKKQCITHRGGIMTTVLFQWEDDYSVGIEEIDEQHKELVRLLNNLHQAIHEHHGSDASRKILNELAEYTHIHFTVEESLMRVSSYPDFEIHKKIHEALIQQVQELQTKLDAGGVKISFELMHFLKNWLMHHINESDKQFGKYMAQVQFSSKRPPAAKATIEHHKGRWKFW